MKSVATERTSFLTAFYYYNSSDFENMYNALAPSPTIPAPALLTMISDLSSVSDNDIYTWFTTYMSCIDFVSIFASMPDNEFDAVLASLGSADLGALLAAHTANMAEIMNGFDAWRFSVYTAGTQSASDWTTWYTTTQYYFTPYPYLLANFPNNVSAAQESGYMSKEDYIQLIKNYFGTRYYDSIQNALPQGSHYVETFRLDELYLYGSSRLGSINENLMLMNQHFNASYSGLTGVYSNKQNIIDSVFTTVNIHYKTQDRGKKRYELTNHLGNVLAVISDQWRTNCLEVIAGDDTSHTFLTYLATVTQATDYSAFGAPLPGRTFALAGAEKYPMGMNGQMMDDEVAGAGNTYTAEFWEYDARIGKRFNLDPVTKVWESPYACFANNPICIVDLKGDDSASVSYTPSANQAVVSPNSVQIIKEIATKAGLKNVTITSTYRSPKHDIEVMYQNVKNKGVEHQKALYGAKGDAIMDAYAEASKVEGATPESIIDAMIAKANEVGFMSKHSDPNYAQLNTIDISYNSMTTAQYNLFMKLARADSRISTVFGKENNDPSIHLEIPVLNNMPVTVNKAQDNSMYNNLPTIKGVTFTDFANNHGSNSEPYFSIKRLIDVVPNHPWKESFDLYRKLNPAKPLSYYLLK